jgi:hypothetical protein
MVFKLSQHTPNLQPEPNDARGGIDLTIAPDKTCVSPIWHLGGFAVQFVGLPAGEAMDVDLGAGRVFLKVITGTVAGGREAFPKVSQVVTTGLDQSQVVAERDAVLCLVTETTDALEQITSMDQLPLRGPLEKRMIWQTFAEKFGAFTEAFDGLEAHMVPGFHLLDVNGDEICYVHFWTTGKGVDVSTHNHGQKPTPLSPAFAEVHLVLRNGTGKGGMYRCDAPDAEVRETMPIQAGEEHGPFFHFDQATGKPKLRENGAVDYPWHGWQGGTDDTEFEVYDLVAAFEISPSYARV